MASKVDVFDQIRDLESFIDDFAAETTDIIEHDEKTEVPSPIIYQKPNEKTLVEEEPEEKVLVEAPIPLNMIDYKLNISDDFSSLVTQFRELTVSPVEYTPIKLQPVVKPVIEPIIVSASDSTLHLLSPPQSQRRRGSVSSKRSQKSQKSVKSVKSFKSARRHVNKQQKQKERPKYIQRSYDEMMRIPDIYERISFYDKTLDLCLKTDSPITQWSTANKLKGQPQALVEGYSKNILSFSSSFIFSPEDTLKSTSSTFGSSISMFLKKATSTQSFQQSPQMNYKNNSYGSPYQQQQSLGLFGRSISRFQLSKSTQLPKHDKILVNNRVTHTKSRNLSPLSMTSQSPLQASSSTPTKVHDGLSYLMNILPQIDIKILQMALEEAKGDPMLAISIAVSKNKSTLPHETLPHKKKPMKKFRV